MTRTLRAIQDEYERETGERPDRATASWIRDQEAEAEYQRKKEAVKAKYEAKDQTQRDEPSPERPQPGGGTLLTL